MLSSIMINYLSYRVIPVSRQENPVLVKDKKDNVKPISAISSNMNHNAEGRRNYYEGQNNKKPINKNNVFDHYLENEMKRYKSDKGEQFNKLI